MHLVRARVKVNFEVRPQHVCHVASSHVIRCLPISINMSRTNSKHKQGFYVHAPNIVAVIKPNPNERRTHQRVTAHTNRSTTVVDIEDDEDLKTLTKAAEVDGFSYTMGEDLSGMEAPEAPLDGDLDGVRVTA